MYVKIGNERIELPDAFGKGDEDKENVEIKIRSINGIPFPREFGDECPLCHEKVRWARAQEQDKTESISLVCPRCSTRYVIYRSKGVKNE